MKVLLQSEKKTTLKIDGLHLDCQSRLLGTLQPPLPLSLLLTPTQVLQQHVAFFDPDSDGVVSPRDTYNGFRRLGWSPLLAVGSAMIINSIFSYPTLPPGQWIPDFKLRIYTERIHKGKHGSDSGTFDHEGRFIPQHFEDLFSKYAGRDKQDITKAEIFAYVKSQRNVLDVIGWAAALLECMFDLFPYSVERNLWEWKVKD